MAVNRDSNGYTITFSIIMVIVVGALLASIAMALKPMQKANEADKKKMDILAAVGLGDDVVNRKNASEMFEKHLVSSQILNSKGEVVEGLKNKKGEDMTAFEIDIKKDYKDKSRSADEKYYPVYVMKSMEGKEYFVVPMVGTGLWGPIWGFVSVDAEDGRTVYGASFDHKTETPGLGAEIKEGFFEEKFIGQQIFNGDGVFTTIEVKKSAVDASDRHAVQGITGGTITSNGVGEMLKRTLKMYSPYIKANS